MNDLILKTATECKDYLKAAEVMCIDRTITDSNDGLVHKKSMWVAWKSGKYGINPCDYGALSPFVDMCIRHNHHEGREWIVRHLEDFVACYWAAKKWDGNPPGEGCAIIDGVFHNWDSDSERHVTMAGVIDATMRLRFMIPDSLYADILEMCLDWGEWWLTRRYEKKLREVHRFFNPLNDMVALFELTGDPKWQSHAHAMFWHGWSDATMRQWHGNRTWDSGYPWEKRGFVAGDLISYSWYQGEATEAFIRFFPHALPDARQQMIKVLSAFMGWHHHDWRKHCQTVPGTGMINCQMHGGMFDNGDSPWVTKDNLSDLYSVPGFFSMADSDFYVPECSLEWHLTDGGYADEFIYDPDGNEWIRDHHQTNGPSLTVGDGFNIATIFEAHSLLTGSEEDHLRALMTTYNYMAFVDHSSPGRVVRREKANKDWYAGAAGKSRGLAWRMKCNWRGRQRWLS